MCNFCELKKFKRHISVMPVRTENSDSDVVVMQSTEERK
jgi:hypothetical protein